MIISLFKLWKLFEEEIKIIRCKAGLGLNKDPKNFLFIYLIWKEIPI